MPNITPESEWLRDAIPGEYRESDCTGRHHFYKSQSGKVCLLQNALREYAHHNRIRIGMAHKDNHTLVVFKACPEYSAFLDTVDKGGEGGKRL